MPSWHGAIPIQTHDEIPGFFKERGPNWWKQRSLGSSVSGDLCCPQIPVSEATNVDWGLLRAGAGHDQEGLQPLSLLVWEGAEDQGRAAGPHKEIWESFLSSTYTRTHLGFPGCLEHLLLQQMHDGACLTLTSYLHLGLPIMSWSCIWELAWSKRELSPYCHGTW